MRRLPLLALVSLLSASPAFAHYNMLLPENWSAKKDEAVTFTYQWGHPYEHQLFDAPAPESVTVLAPDGKVSDVTKSLEKIGLGDKKVTAYRFKFTPDQRSDYVFVLRTPPIWMAEDGEYLQDTVRAWCSRRSCRTIRGAGRSGSPSSKLNATTPLPQRPCPPTSRSRGR
jgi:hypothetical protein